MVNAQTTINVLVIKRQRVKIEELLSVICLVMNTGYISKPLSLPYSFPLGNEARLQQWMVNVWRQNWKPNATSRLCSLHFEDDCFSRDPKRKRRLNKTAKPTMFSFPQSFAKQSVRSGVTVCGK